MAAWGAFAFGVVLGWFVYFTNRYRKNDVQFGDLVSLVGVVGGGAVTSLFGPASSTMFGFYGVGLAVGFFAYFLTLLVFVRLSNGAFSIAWFLDGRRRRLADNEEIPGENRSTTAAMDLQFQTNLLSRAETVASRAARELVEASQSSQEFPLLQSQEIPMTTNENHYCCSLTAGPISNGAEIQLSGTRGAFLDGARWTVGQTITIRFLEGSPTLKKRVQKVANEWTQIANLIFDFRNDAPTDIRIAFQPGKGSWSYIGTTCRRIPEPDATMNYGWLTDESTDDEVRRVVLHEFGHAIGMIHEHQNPKGGGIDWNRAAVIADLSGPPNNWDEAKIETNMFKKYKVASATDIDALSIMMYPIPKSWTNDGTTAGLNSELSAVDRSFVAENYPK